MLNLDFYGVDSFLELQKEGYSFESSRNNKCLSIKNYANKKLVEIVEQNGNKIIIMKSNEYFWASEIVSINKFKGKKENLVILTFLDCERRERKAIIDTIKMTAE